jgi:putative membrane protein
MKALAMVLLLVGCSPNIEQEAPPAPRVQSAPSANLASQDRDFLERAAEGNNAEIAMGTLAVVDGYTARAEVAAFGRMMVADHGAMKKQLAAIANVKRIALPTSLGEHQQNFDRIVDLHRDEFDREFARAMLADHQAAVRLFRDEASGGVDADLKAFAAATLPKIEEHLRHAEALARMVSP